MGLLTLVSAPRKQNMEYSRRASFDFTVVVEAAAVAAAAAAARQRPQEREASRYSRRQP